MIKIVSSPADLVGFDTDHFYSVFSPVGERFDLVAIASSVQEAHDAQEMLADLKGGVYHITPPKAQTN